MRTKVSKRHIFRKKSDKKFADSDFCYNFAPANAKNNNFSSH